MTDSSLMILVLAAGMGTRMKSKHPKVMHKIGSKPMVGHVLDLGGSLGAEKCAVVVGPDMDQVADVAEAHFDGAKIYTQSDRLGTAHAVLSAREILEGHEGYVLVLYGDTPLLTQDALIGLLDELKSGADVGVLGFEADDPTGYGRLLVDEEGSLTAIREQKDASSEELAIKFCNSGVMGFRSRNMLSMLDEVGNDNANGEYYLTDVIEIARQRGLKAVATQCSEQDVLGVNDRVQLAEAEAIFQNRKREEAQRNGATLVAPDTVYFAADTVIGKDVIIDPFVVFGPNVTVGDDVHIHSHCHFEGAHIEAKATIGPFARLRPGAQLGEGSKVGNFVEVKKAKVGKGAKINHLTYIGDAEVGEEANIGAGTITCNYDGYNKNLTKIGARCFVGSNSSLIAPVTLGDGAYIGSGSVISENVPDDALAVTRAEKKVYERWAARFRKSQERRKAAIDTKN